VLASPYHIVLVIGITTGLVVHKLRKKYKAKVFFKYREIIKLRLK